MKRTTVSCAAASFMLLFSVVSQANGDQSGGGATSSKEADSKFQAVDDMLKRLEDASRGKLVPAKNSAPELTDLGGTPGVSAVELAAPRPVFVESSVLKQGSPPLRLADKPTADETPQSKDSSFSQVGPDPVVLASQKNMTRISDLPPYSRFDFQLDVFIPAHKQGVLFADGKMKYAIESGVDITKLLVSRPESERTCMLLSDKSYVMMRGKNDGTRQPSNLEVASVQFKEWKDQSGASAFFAEVNFLPKASRDGATDEVNVSIHCRVPRDTESDIKGYALWQLNDAMGGLFSFQLPRYIEI